MAKITKDDLTQEFVREMFDYIPEGRLVRRKSTRGSSVGTVAGCINKLSGYRQVGIGDNLTVLEHRLIFFWHHGFWPEMTDHINMDRTDNRIENLREATNSKNQMNVKVRTFTKSGLKGVHWDSIRGLWIARIKINGKHIFLGRFKDMLDAYDARKKAQYIHGEFARM